MSEDLPLSDLCNICKTIPPKYCCPRCRCLTCSLRCYKRHKAWSQCSGKRDPTEYLKRSQLGTPAGIDHDFNFLTGIEQAFDRVDRFHRNKGISLDDSVGTRKPAGARLAERLEETGVIIHRAPKGMTRQKQNATQIGRYNGEDYVSWTLEWIFPDKSRKCRNANDWFSYRDAYKTLRSQTSVKGRKRKRELAAKESTEVVLSLQELGADQHKDEEETKIIQELADLTTASTVSDSDPNKPPEGEPYFYLFRPLTPGSEVVLIPLSPTESIKASLKNREILEFPTIYVLPEPPLELPDGFQLERDYIIKSRHMIKELDEQLAPFLNEEGNEADQKSVHLATSDEDQVFQESRILESLQRDLATRTEQLG